MFFCTAPVTLPFALGPMVERARIDSGLKFDSLAYLMGITRQQLAEQLSGARHLSFPRLLMVTTDPDGRRFFKALMLAIFEQVGIEDRDQVAATLRQVIDAFQSRETRGRMAKADIRPAQEERKSA
jgi:hypothetical protein